MGFGSSKIVFCILIFLCWGNASFQAQERSKTSTYLYNQLDFFRNSPSKSHALKLSKMIVSEENKLQTKEDQLAWVIVNCNLGYYYNQYNNPSAAILYYEKAWKTYQEKQLNDYDIIENCLQPLGNIYIQVGDLPKAESTISHYLYLAEKSHQPKTIATGISNLSISFNNRGDYAKALNILRQGLAIDPNNVNILTNIATNHMQSGDMVQAEHVAKKVIALDPDQINAYQILAAAALERKQIKVALDYMEKAKLKLMQRSKTSSRDIAKLQLAYLDILLSQSEFTEAQQALNEIYTTLLPGYAKKTGLPLEQKLIADRILLKALDVHAFVYQQTEKPLLATEAFELAFKVNSKLNTLYPLQNTKIIQHSQHRNRTEKYIGFLFSLYKSSGDTDFIKKAFQAAEHSKAPFINEALVSKTFLSEYKNDTLVSQKDELTSSLAVYETLILKEKLKGNIADIDMIQQWSTAHSSKSIELKEIVNTLEHKYPDLLQKNRRISISDLQEKLKKDKATLIEYFYGKEAMYQFEISGSSFTLKKIAASPDILETIKQHIRYFDNASMINNNVPGFSKSASEVFEILKIPKNVTKLLIIPDGLLNFIPFETLLTEETQSIRFQHMPFLMKTSEVSYEISAGKYIRSSPAPKKENTVLGVFPVFEGDDLELSFSLSESNAIQQYYKGTFLKKEQATYTNFIQRVEEHSIIHLSTHAESGSFTRPASIKFIDQDVLVNQLYGLNLDTELVVLSACETGVGKLAKGEGPLSIGRGFQYAGVGNMLFSLWKVNDKTTSQLMRGFYKNLNQSGSKSNALHQAKQEYLENKDFSNTQKSPYFWASFIYYGEISNTTSTSHLWRYLGLSVFIIIMLLLHSFFQRSI